MTCPQCGYAMTPLDRECPRCHGKGLAGRTASASPQPSTHPRPAMQAVSHPTDHQTGESILADATGLNGQLLLFEDHVRIQRKGGWAVMTQGLKGDKDILLASISSIQFKPCGAMTNGYIQFAFLGGAESKASLMQAGGDENTVMFTAVQQERMEWFKKCVETQRRKVMAPAPQAVSAPLSEVEQIEKLAALRDRGILTEDEFQAKKKQILGL